MFEPKNMMKISGVYLTKFIEIEEYNHDGGGEGPDGLFLKFATLDDFQGKAALFFNKRNGDRIEFTDYLVEKILSDTGLNEIKELEGKTYLVGFNVWKKGKYWQYDIHAIMNPKTCKTKLEEDKKVPMPLSFMRMSGGLIKGTSGESIDVDNFSEDVSRSELTDESQLPF